MGTASSSAAALPGCCPASCARRAAVPAGCGRPHPERAVPWSAQHADRRRPPVRLRAVRAPARPAAVRALALGAVARRDDGRRRLAALAPAGGPRAAPARGRVRPPAVRPARARARARWRAPATCAPGAAERARDRLDHVHARAARARDARRVAPRGPSGNTFPRERRYHRPRRGGRRPPHPASPSRSRRSRRSPTTTAGPGRPAAPSCSPRSTPSAGQACAANPVRLLQETHPDRLAARRRATPAFLERLAALQETLAAALAEETLEEATVPPTRPAAFFCAEYAVHGSLPVYSGGLGVLAGDILKEASDRALPLVAVGLMYRHGYFRQRIDASGWQHEYWVDTDPDRVPGALVTGEDGEPVTVTVPLGDRELVAQIWRVDVGRVPLLLLDADRPGERRRRPLDHLAPVRRRRRRAPEPVPAARHRRRARAARARRRARRRAPQRGPRGVRLRSSWRAPSRAGATTPFEAVRRRTVFTTHTPGAGGQRHLPRRRRSPRAWAGSPPRWASTSATSSAAAAPTPTTRASRSASRSSRCARRGSPTASAPATARSRASMWHGLWPDRAVEDVPIAHVTNGVHIPTWIGAPLRELLDRHLGEGWMDRAVEPVHVGRRRGHPRRRPVGGPQRAAPRADRARAARAA